MHTSTPVSQTLATCCRRTRRETQRSAGAREERRHDPREQATARAGPARDRLPRVAADERTPQRAFALSLPIKLREGQNTLVVTAIDADGVVQQDVRAVEYARPTPLKIGVRFPEDRAKITEESSMVVAEITSGKGVGKVSVQLKLSSVS